MRAKAKAGARARAAKIVGYLIDEVTMIADVFVSH